ncbi:hypothetical protein O4220_21965 [Rhodococcus ruber]|uniref:Uncharacterized protein n=1 Tax=Rhodococcus ruber TaxID=1830 RepID=A0ABT4MJN2_9NOCA|nr:hypothetical protein [Rhodococcus ruber]MCZ4521188.1 hypothetical protein [Rhodococcus ruber]
MALLTGCSAGDSNEAAPPGDTAVGPTVPGDLDTGTFRTIPQAPFGSVTDEKQGRLVEGQRMAEFVVIPSEIDPKLVQSYSQTTGPFASAEATRKTVFTDGQADVLAAQNLVMGFGAGAGYRPDEPGVDPATRNGLAIRVMRFPDAGSAERAARGLIEQTYLPTEYSEGAQPSAIDVLPNTLVSSKSDVDGLTSSDSFTARGDYVIDVEAHAPVGQEDWVARSIATTVDRQGTLIDTFPATPLDGFASLPIDVDKILVLTLEEDDENRDNSRRAVYGPRGAAHFSTDSTRMLEEFEQSNSDLQASNGTTVYRSADAAGAGTMYEMLVKEYEEMGFAVSAGAPGVPDSTCLTQDTTVGVRTACLLHQDRYTAEFSVLEDETKAHQMAAAQYSVLKTATES